MAVQTFLAGFAVISLLLFGLFIDWIFDDY
jgi:hypothetical protein